MKIPSVKDIRQFFVDELNDEAFTIDKTGQKTIEMIGASFIADQPTIFGEVNQYYVDAEITWYENQSTNIQRFHTVLCFRPLCRLFDHCKQGSEFRINQRYLAAIVLSTNRSAA